MRVFISADHGGFLVKEELKKYLMQKGYEVGDGGAYELNSGDDYPDFVLPLALRVAQGKQDVGIVIGKSGNGEAIVANKVKGVRAAVCVNPEMARLAREHNNANILSLGTDFIDLETAKKVVDVFLTTQFSDEERHKRRIEKISRYESYNS